MRTHCWLVGLLLTLPVFASVQTAAPLQLVQTIAMPNVKGRIDHMDVDVNGNRLFVAGLENGSLEVVDLHAGKWSKSIPGFKKTQGVAYVRSLNKVFVASGDDGMLRVFHGDTLDLLDAVKLDFGPNRVVFNSPDRSLCPSYHDWWRRYAKAFAFGAAVSVFFRRNSALGLCSHAHRSYSRWIVFRQRWRSPFIAPDPYLARGNHLVRARAHWTRDFIFAGQPSASRSRWRTT